MQSHCIGKFGTITGKGFLYGHHQLVNYSQQLYSISQELYQKANAFLTMYQYYQKQLGKLANLKDPVCLQFAIATCKTPAPMFSLQDFYYPDKDVIDTYIKLLETYLWRM